MFLCPHQIPPFLKIQDVPSFFRLIGKTKVLKDSFNHLVDHIYPQSILILEQYLQSGKMQNAFLSIF